MPNTYQNSSTHQPSRRYTISCLLQLAHGRRSFDLSKFSYDAARAGVVPPLGDCAMSSRRSSTTRARGWSSASFETSEDIVVFGGNINSANIVQPDRQPVNPPPEAHAAKDAGFVRFLKKHSSPTHNRVTAGGRIVPMEKRESPPRFNLPASMPSTGQEEVHIEQQMASQSLRIAGAVYQEPAFQNQSGPPGPMSNIMQEVNDGNAMDSTAVVNGISETTASSAQTPCLTISNASLIPHSVQGNQFNPYLSHMLPQNLGNHTSAQMAYSSMQSTMPFPSYAWPFADAYNTGVVNAAANFHLDPQMQLILSGSQMLVDAEALFNNLDRQLKLIDRHRAMNTHDPNLAAQRMAIVQQRADAKESAKRLKMQLGVEQDRFQSQGRIPFTAAMTPAFAPKSGAPVQQSATTPSINASETVRAPASADKSHPTAKRKPLPIVPPPPSSPVQAEPCKKDNASTMVKPLVRVDDIQDSNQGEDAQASCELDTQKSPSSRTSVTPRQTTASEKSGLETTKEASETKLDHGKKPHGGVCQTEWMQMRTGETPSAVEAIYELQLDAMRLPEGVEVLIPLSNGSHVTVRGCKLGRPSMSLMSDFEKDYWDRKPAYTVEMLESLKAQATIKDISVLLTDEYLVTNADGPPASPTDAESASGSEYQERVEKYADDKSKSLREYATMSHVSTKSELSVVHDAAKRDRPFASARMMITTTGVQSDEDLRSDGESMTFDEMSHKGYSSVSIQNINVQVQLPPPGFDGATDPNRCSAAVSSLMTAGKQRSPRLLHRSAPNGGA